MRSSSIGLLTVYPSPVSSVLTIEFISDINYIAKIQVLGSNGQRRLLQTESLLSIPDGKGKLQTTRFMKIKGQ